MHSSTLILLLLSIRAASSNICQQKPLGRRNASTTYKNFHNGICMQTCPQRATDTECHFKYCSRKNTISNERRMRLRLYSLDARLNFFFKRKQCSWLFTNSPNASHTTYLVINNFYTQYSNDFLFVYNQSEHANNLLASINNQLQADGESLVLRFSYTPKLLLLLNINNLINNTFSIDLTYEYAAESEPAPSKHRSSYILVRNNTEPPSVIQTSLNDSLEANLRRSFHKSLSVGQEVFIVGGYFQQPSSVDSPQFGLIYSLADETWHKMADSEPSHRFAHTLTHDPFNSRLVLFGGIIFGSNVVTNEMWFYELATREWSLQSPRSLVRPIAVSGHSSVLLGSSIYNFFGYSSKQNAYLSQLVQIFDVVTQRWRVIKIASDTFGGSVKIGYLHAAVLDPSKRLIYLFGGLMLASNYNHILSNHLYAFDASTDTIRALKPAKHSVFLHTGVLHNGDYLAFFAGKAFNSFNSLNNLSDLGSSFKITRKIQIYNMRTQTWYLLNATDTSLKRYAHSDFSVNASHHGLFAGYNGLFLDDIALLNLTQILNTDSMESTTVYEPSAANGTEAMTSRFDDASILALALAKRIDPCEPYPDCRSCYLNNFNCTWRWETSTCVLMPHYENSIDIAALCGADLTLNNSYRGLECRAYNSCANCTQMDHCMWCDTAQTCFNRNAIRIMYHFGECLNFVTDRSKCELSHECSFYTDCNRCVRDERCGWCSLSRPETGRGVCLQGNSDSSFNRSFCYDSSTDWHFSKCPACQCNGHSTCEGNSSRCISCGDNTMNDEVDSYVDTTDNDEEENNYSYMSNTGFKSQCSKCMPGFYGDARNGGTCNKCRCNAKQSNYCDSNDGRCFCFTKGVTGKLCNLCESPRYWGNVMANNGYGTCFYELSTDYQFTFNLNKESDKHFTQINFSNSPTRLDDDIDFAIKCLKDSVAMFNLSYSVTAKDFRALTLNMGLGSSAPLNRSPLEPLFIVGETALLSQINCTGNEYKYTFSPKSQLNLLPFSNLTLFVYVYQFRTPIAIQISFSYRSKIQIFHFFLTFFGCFVSLLAFAFIFWKSKQRFDRYRRERRMMHEMREMANRPFVKLLVRSGQVEPDLGVKDAPKTDSSDDLLERSSKVEVVQHGSVRSKEKSSRFEALSFKRFFHVKNVRLKGRAKTKRPNAVLVQSDKNLIEQNIMPVALEPLSSNKAAIASVLIRLPKASADSKASSPFLIGSTLVAINVVHSAVDEDELKDAVDGDGVKNEEAV